MKEIEVKFHIENTEPFIERLNKLAQIRSKSLIYDIYYDDSTKKFKQKDNVLRLRRDNKDIYLAYKTPREKGKLLIERKEYEVKVEDFVKTKIIIRGLGFKPIEIVEKERITYGFNNNLNCKLLLDRLPFLGSYIEIEGVEKDILVACSLLHLDINERKNFNYTELFLEFCQNNNVFLKTYKTKLTFYHERKFHMTL
jgi:adenylate cyclase, class 2